MPTFSDIADADLDSVVEAIQHSSPRSGAVMVWGKLKSYDISVSRQCVRESLVRVNPVSVELPQVRAYSWPSRISSDCGGENTEVARCMTSTRGQSSSWFKRSQSKDTEALEGHV